MTDVDARRQALIAHPMTHGSMKEVAVQDGWLGIVERMYAKLEAAGCGHHVVTHVGEKFGRLIVLTDVISSESAAAVRFAAGEACRTCQVCGLRGSVRIIDGWMSCLCNRHHAEAETRTCDADDKAADWALHVVVHADRSSQLSACDLATGDGCTWSFPSGGPSDMVPYLAGMIESGSVVIALDPAAVVTALGGRLPFFVHPAADILRGIAADHGRDLAAFDRLISAAAEGDDLGVAHAVSGVARWACGEDGAIKFPTGQIAVAGRARAKRIKRRGFDAVVSFENVGQRLSDRLRFHRDPHPEQLVVIGDDIDDPHPGDPVPTVEDMVRLLDLGRRHREGAVLIHCNAGVARSTAAALAILADRYGPGLEAEALAATLRLRPCAVPNLHLARLADDTLGRGGALTAVVLDLDARSEWCRWRRATNLAAHNGTAPPLWPKGLKVPGDEDVEGMIER